MTHVAWANLCDSGSQQLIRSSPDKNAVEVPTNAQIILVHSYGSQVDITLNDKPLTPAGSVGAQRYIYQPADKLEPNTLYRIVGTFVGGSTTGKFSRQFTTGPGSTTDEAPAINDIDHNVSDLDIAHLCGQLAAAQQCPHESTVFISLQLNPSIPLLLISHEEDGDTGAAYIWPSECLSYGFPADNAGMTNPCLQLKSLNLTGHESSSMDYCPNLNLGASSGGSRRKPGCTQSHIPAPKFGLGWLSIVFLGIWLLSRKDRFANNSNEPAV